MSQSTPINSTNLDQSSPYFINSSYDPNSLLVTSIFNGVGFNSLKRSMIAALATKNKTSFVDGSILKPSDTNSSYSNWFRANSMVISWLLNSLHKNIVEILLFLQTAKEI